MTKPRRTPSRSRVLAARALIETREHLARVGVTVRVPARKLSLAANVRQAGEHFRAAAAAFDSK